MTVARQADHEPKINLGSSFRWNDEDVVCRFESARAMRAWVPAFAGMTG